jgi:4'-phosphopantetheinyl transferase
MRLLRNEGLVARVSFRAIGSDELPSESPHWLGRSEQLVFARLVLPKRRRDWLAGRSAAKRAVGLLIAGPSRPPDEAIEIVARASGAPAVLVGGRSCSVRVSIAHAGDLAGAIAWHGSGLPLGLDLEPLVTPERSLDRVAFTAAESTWARADHPAAERPLRLWTAKEAVLKAVEEGLRADLRQVEVSPGPTEAAWSARYRGDLFRVRHAVLGGYVTAIAVRCGNAA